MREYKRLTERAGKGVAIKETSANDNKSIWNAIERLAELEDKIENQTLIKLPCKVGDKVYVIDRNNNLIEMEIISYMATNKYVVYSAKHIEEEYIYSLYDSELNYDWFLTKSEAEQKLKELKEQLWNLLCK